MKVAIIGAGPAGLCAGRHCLQENCFFDIFEQTGVVGGTWNYVDYTGYDENGIPIHSSMYKDLMSNLPKEIMAYEDLPYPNYEESYVSQAQVLDYINSYAKKFQIENHIKFYKRVHYVEPLDNVWFVEIEDVRNKRKEAHYYNAVMVCNGHCTDAFIPEIPGVGTFRGSVMHSHDYRTCESYKNKRVLIIGGGTSAYDISEKIATVAQKVYVSSQSEPFFSLSDYLYQKPCVTKVDENRVIFKDGTAEEIDAILYCTGYNYTFPFLSRKCGVNVTDNYVHPLYKQMISIEHPTLSFIALPLIVCYFPLFDIQVRFFLSTLNGHYKLPSKKHMLQDLNQAIAKMSSRAMRKYHVLPTAVEVYFEELATTANIKRTPPVIPRLFTNIITNNRNRNRRFRIIDDENWEQL